MTYNATSPRLALAARVGLVEHTPPRESSGQRLILCPSDINDYLKGLVAKGDYPAMDAAVTIGRFLAGHSLVVSRKLRPPKRRKPGDRGVELEQLEGFDEIWVLCHRRPGAGWRLVGRMLEQDVLVVFGLHDKRDIGTDYGPVVGETITEWERCFPGLPPCNGPWLSGYLSGAHRDVDEEQN